MDSGRIRVPFYNVENDNTEMLEIFAPLSTIKQRKGRLGRLNKIGDYYLCNSKSQHTKEYHASELEKLDLTDVYFNLLCKLNDSVQVKDILSRIPTSNELELQNKIKVALSKLEKLGILKVNKAN